MGGISEKKKRTAGEAVALPVTGDSVKKQLAVAAGTEYFQNRDPIYHITESFRQTFDLMGQQRARGDEPSMDDMLSVYMNDETPGLDSMGDREREGGNEGDAEGGGGLSEEFLHKTSMNPHYQPRDMSQQNRLMDKFAEVSFNRGNLAASVIRGTGKMMLFSCLKRTVGQNEPQKLRERMLFQSNSVHRHIPGQRENIGVVNRGFADSAVGLVVDVLKDARQTLDSLTAMAEGKGGVDGKSGVGTLKKQYPFLTDDEERGLLEQYRDKLEASNDPEERQVLQRAIEKTEALIHKKDQMKREFLQKLRQLSHCATTASAVFSQEDFRQSVYKELEQEDTAEPPPDDGGGGPDDEDHSEEI